MRRASHNAQRGFLNHAFCFIAEATGLDAEKIQAFLEMKRDDCYPDSKSRSCYDGQPLSIYLLQGSRYELSDRSVALPSFSAEAVMKILELRSIFGENALVKQFRQ